MPCDYPEWRLDPTTTFPWFQAREPPLVSAKQWSISYQSSWYFVPGARLTTQMSPALLCPPLPPLIRSPPCANHSLTGVLRPSSYSLVLCPAVPRACPLSRPFVLTRVFPRALWLSRRADSLLYNPDYRPPYPCADSARLLD